MCSAAREPRFSSGRICFNEEDAGSLLQRKVISLADVVNGVRVLRWPVIGLLVLLGGATTNGGTEAISRFADEGVNDFGLVAGIDPDLVGDQ